MAEQDELAGRVTPPGMTKADKTSLKAPVDTGQVVEAWFKEFFPNSPVSRDTEAWNLLLWAKDVLKQRLKGD